MGTFDPPGISQSRADARYPAIGDVRSGSYVDFTTHGTGAAPSTDDAGNPVMLRYTPTQNPPKMVSGKLVADPTSDTGTYATYWQINDGSANHNRVGCAFTVNGNDAGNWGVTLALWDHDFAVGTGASIPEARAHLVVNPGGAGGLGFWRYWICDSAGHIVAVVTGNFTAQAYDDTATWIVDLFIDEDTGNAYITLPDDSVAVVTAAQIAAAAAGQAGWSSGTTLKSLSGKVAMVEHYSQTSPLTNVATAPKFTAFWSEKTTAPRNRRFAKPSQTARAVRKVYDTLNGNAPSGSAYLDYAPSTELDYTVTGSAAAIDATNFKLAATIPNNGKLIIRVAFWLEMVTSGSASVFYIKLSDGVGTNYGTHRILECPASTTQKREVVHEFELGGFTPGTTITFIPQVLTSQSSTGTVKMGSTNFMHGQISTRPTG